MTHLVHTILSNDALRRVFVCVAGVLMLCVPARGAEVVETLIVLSSDATPYVQAADACEARLRNASVPVRRVMLSSLSASDLAHIANPVVAIGGRSAVTLGQGLPDKTQLYYCMTPDPGQSGLAERANTAGISTETDLRVQLSLIQGGVKSIKRIGVLYRSGSAKSSKMLRAMQSVLPPDLEIVAMDLDKAKSDSEGIKHLIGDDIDIVWTVADAAVYNSGTIRALLLESLRSRVPVFGFSHALVRAGATFGIGIDPGEQGAEAADLLLRHATDTHELAKAHVAVNRIAGDRIRMKLPESLVRQADVVFAAD